jgi:predicted aconitase
MLHIAGHTPESGMPPHRHAGIVTIDQPTLAKAWQTLNAEEASIDLVAVGRPHASLDELHRIVDLFGRRTCPPDIHFIVCAGRDVIASAGQDGTAGRLKASGVRLVADICWCSMTEPVFPPDTKVLITNSGKYAHYADGLSGRKVRLAGLEACVEAALTGTAPAHPPDWVSRQIAD